MKSCVFCPHPRTTTRGEHIWDNWLNRQDGHFLKFHYNVTEYGSGDAPIREYPTRKLDATKDVVCDTCNQTWMSEVTSQAKDTIEGFIRYGRPATLLPLGIVTVVTFALMKCMVLDCAYEDERKPLFSPLACALFRESLTTAHSAPVAFPAGVQVWMAAYRRTREVEARVWINGLVLKTGRYAGFNVLMITYAISAFVFQLTFPRWTRLSRRPSDWPFITQAKHWDDFAVPIWPGVDGARWPPAKHLDSGSLENFCNRFGTDAMLTRL